MSLRKICRYRAGPSFLISTSTQDRPQENRLGQRHVVSIDEPLGGQVIELEHPVLVAEIGEERRQQCIRVEVELLAHLGKHLVAAKAGRGAGAGLAPWANR